MMIDSGYLITLLTIIILFIIILGRSRKDPDPTHGGNRFLEMPSSSPPPRISAMLNTGKIGNLFDVIKTKNQNAWKHSRWDDSIALPNEYLMILDTW